MEILKEYLEYLNEQGRRLNNGQLALGSGLASAFLMTVAIKKKKEREKQKDYLKCIEKCKKETKLGIDRILCNRKCANIADGKK